MRVEKRRVWYDIEAVIGATKETRMYKKARIWLEIVFRALRTGLGDSFRDIFDLANEIQQAKGETGSPHTDATWEAAYQALCRKEQTKELN